MFRKLLPLTKVEEQSDGSLYVYGCVTAEEVDRDGEVCDYASTVPYYKAVNDEMSKATDGKNIMPLREMHQLSAVGAGKSIHFDDRNKRIEMGFEVVDRAAVTKVRAGVYTGFSQGGDYVKTWNANGVKHYTAKPGEISLVDRGSAPSAVFEYVKADGSKELRKFAKEQPQMFRTLNARVEELERLRDVLKRDLATAEINAKVQKALAFNKSFRVGLDSDTTSPLDEEAREAESLAHIPMIVNAVMARRQPSEVAPASPAFGARANC